ncbi:hypothetical protein ITP53_36800 [Nonomuraea sp. K274]|uniref:Uncharacterized protein n=1 Tax=Nonomuraea cypriaca TaxID=1187855 RepID=A0A931AE36_9ACTN|nr:hypothetical protein [Nonomuraea cypriaca]
MGSAVGGGSAVGSVVGLTGGLVVRLVGGRVVGSAVGSRLSRSTGRVERGCWGGCRYWLRVGTPARVVLGSAPVEGTRVRVATGVGWLICRAGGVAVVVAVGLGSSGEVVTAGPPGWSTGSPLTGCLAPDNRPVIMTKTMANAIMPPRTDPNLISRFRRSL